jgi:hypothetical protein
VRVTGVPLAGGAAGPPSGPLDIALGARMAAAASATGFALVRRIR